MARQGECPGEGEGRGKQRDVPELDHLGQGHRARVRVSARVSARVRARVRVRSRVRVGARVRVRVWARVRVARVRGHHLQVVVEVVVLLEASWRRC